ncbi:MAG: glycosyltransferase family 4 protein [Pirellulaceae bacterium]
MNVWLIHPGELLPIDGSVRLNRYGILAEMLASRGHRVTIWAPTFVHTTKQYRSQREELIEVQRNYHVRLMHAPGYRRHIGWARWQFHRRLAARFTVLARQEVCPDVIVSGIPAPELCDAATSYGRARGIPVVIDVRDVWPDAALDHAPAWAQPILRPMLAPMVALNRRVFRAATGIVGVSEGFRDWGLAHARRGVGPADGVFHLGYPEATHTDRDKEAARDQWAAKGVVPDGTFRCYFMASIGSLYDLETVIEAGRELARRPTNRIQFVLCGDGPRLERLRSIARDVPNVLLPGWAKSVDVQVLMELSHIGTIPYRKAMHTALPNKAVAYFSAGLPVVTNSGGEFASILHRRRCGVTYEPENVADFLRAFNCLRLQPDLRAELSANARHFYEQELDAECVYSRMIDHLSRLAACRVAAAA